ncbi:hypothetical protein UE46_01230 [Listeria weihenstephanensis]|uniref:Bacterial Ig domain-containing protein n=1 Tax=Listeria weihenstephanensis TaxID=1006155 RepID=A0A1S7FR49_9LIST|nr:hypothetical protein [Listeria weihenstephanensis]AQY49815.1 hypothetical protein UE46_01230 [Listeria weihenstephanensis]
MIELALIFVFIGLLTLFTKKKSFKKGMSLFLAVGMVAIILAGCGTSDELTKEEPAKQQEKTPTLKVTTADTFESDENGTVTISGKTEPDAELTLTVDGQSDQTATSDADGKFSFAINEVPADGSAVLTTTWKGQDKSQNITYQANPTYKTKLAKIEQDKKDAEAKVAAEQKKEQERLAAVAAEEQRVEAARVAEEARKVEEKRVADAKAAEDAKNRANARAAAEAKEAEQKRQASEQQPQGEMVYITATGKRYHYTQSCRGLNNSNGETQVTLSDAQSRGLTKCKFE